MAKSIVHGNEIESLKQAIRHMDKLQQRAMGDIATIARLAALALESPAGQQDITSIASAFELLQERATDAWFDINEVAASAGCGFLNSEAIDRDLARHVARETSVKGGDHV